MSQSHSNAIAILDAIPDGELNTARRLREDIEVVAVSLNLQGMVKYFRIESVGAFEDALRSLVKEHQQNGLNPVLHIEGHGFGEKGIALPNGCCTWEKFKKLVTPLNIEMRLNLLVVFATCYGGSFASAITTTDRAPVWGLIGPKGTKTAGQLQQDFVAFYRILFETKSGSQAVNALSTGYYRTSAEDFFLQVWREYKRSSFCSSKGLAERARRMYRQAKALKWQGVPNIGALKRLLRSAEPTLFAKYRDTYFMYDIYSENQSRFAITYERAEEFAAQ